MLGRGALRRGRRRGRRRTRRRMLMAESLMNQSGNDNYDDSPQDDHDESSVDESPAFSDDDADQLEKLAELKDKGIITEEEFDKKKKQILGL